MIELYAATALWVITHLGISNSPLRPALVARLGDGGYLGFYSVLALGTLTWMVMAWSDAPRDLWLWEPRGWQRMVPLAVMPIACMLLIGGLVGVNPTAVGQEARLGEPDVARGMLRVTRHPVQWAILLWALAHMFPNGDAPTLVLLLGVALVAGFGPLLIDRRKAANAPEDFAKFAAGTSWSTLSIR